MNTINIASVIAELRKKNNMTQSALAEKLDVSYQAVSKWERGESLPDISLLPKIADIFGISIDQLIRGTLDLEDEKQIETATKLVVEAANETITEEKEKNIENVIEQIAPMVKPSLMEKMMNKIENKFNGNSSALYPFMSQADFSEFIESNGHELCLNEEIKKMMPFLNRDNRSKVVDIIVEHHNYSEVDFSEFIESNGHELCLNEEIKKMMPFLNRDNRSKVVDIIVEHHNYSEVKKIAPFLNQEQLGNIIDAMKADGETNFKSLLPFLDKRNRNKVMDTIIQGKELDKLSNIYPFMDNETKEKLVQLIVDKDNYKQFKLETVFPFLNSELKEKVCQRLMKEKHINYVPIFPLLPSYVKDQVIDRMIEDGDFGYLEECEKEMNELQRRKVTLAQLEKVIKGENRERKENELNLDEIDNIDELEAFFNNTSDIEEVDELDLDDFDFDEFTELSKEEQDKLINKLIDERFDDFDELADLVDGEQSIKIIEYLLKADDDEVLDFIKNIEDCEQQVSYIMKAIDAGVVDIEEVALMNDLFDDGVLNKVLDEMIEKRQFDDIDEMFPLMSKEQLNQCFTIFKKEYREDEMEELIDYLKHR